MLLATERRYKHYKANEGRIILKDGLLFQKYFGETGSVKYYQILIPKQLVNEVLRNLHGEFGKHPGITKTIIAYREKNYYPNVAQQSGTGSCRVSNALENHELIPDSPTLPCKIRTSTLLRQKTPCKSIWCRDYCHLVAMKTL